MSEERHKGKGSCVHINPTTLKVNQLLGSNDEQYVIPNYQRRYSWKQRQVWDLIDDIALIEDGDTHLLGSVVCLTGHHTAGLNRLELVDGQQRLTTISILLECLRQRLHTQGANPQADPLQRLLQAEPLGAAPVRKLLLDSIDREEFDGHVRGDDTEDFVNARLTEAFATVREWIDELSTEDLNKFVYRLTNQAVIIRLDVSQAKDAFKLFETINNRGLRLSPTDIVKNFLLGNAARFGQQHLTAAKKAWSELLVHLDCTKTDDFFRYYLTATLKESVRAADVIATFKQLFMTRVVEAAQLPERHQYQDDANEVDDEDAATDDSGAEEIADALAAKPPSERMGFKAFLARLVSCAKTYGELVLAKTGDKRIDRHLRNLRMIKAAQTYGFLTHLRAGDCSDKNFRVVLRLTEAFVLRRHVCRERTNETERLFARMCIIVPTDDPVKWTRIFYSDASPSDEKFRDEFAAATFPSNLMERARYCLEQFELAEHGEHEELHVLGAEDVHIEHVIPQKIKGKRAKDEFGDWLEYLGNDAEAKHPKYVSRIGNLTLFAGELNMSASNSPFGRKKDAYKQSGIELTKALAAMPHFKFASVDKRSSELAEKAVELWPRPVI